MRTRSPVLAVLLVTSVLNGQPRVDTNRITLEDLVSVGGAGIHALSPDGKQFATIQDGQIALIPAEGGFARLLTTTPGGKSEVSWSADGKKLAFASAGGIWVVDADGGQPRRLTDGTMGPGDPRGAADRAPRWNPKGRWILYESGRTGNNQLFVVSDDGASTNYLATTEIYDERRYSSGKPQFDDAVSGDRFDPSPAWSRDGTKLAYTERSREFFQGKLKIVDFDLATGRAKTAPREIYTAKPDPGGAWAIDHVAWAPDGKTLAIVLQDSGWDKVYLFPTAGGSPKQLTRGEFEDLTPTWSPDGKSLAVVSNRNIPEERHIWIVPVDGSAGRQLADLPEGVEGNPQWSPDGAKIYFTRSTPLESPDLWVASTVGSSSPHALTHTLPLNFERAGFKMPERVHFKSKDGLEIAGILYKPVGYKPGTRYPAVLSAHGGPEGQDAMTFSSWPMFLAQEGYVVLLPNFRGSTGYGEKFRNLNVRDSGGGEIDDVGAGAQYLIDQGFADPKRIAISGGSHGGTVVANAVTKLPDMFAAGIEMFGVVDRATYNERSNRNSAIRWEIKMGGTPEEVPEVYRKANVLLDVQKIKAPLLILHGQEDPQVPPYESAQFTAALKKYNKVFWYFTYPHEGHGFREREHRLDAWRKQLAFLDKFLQPAYGHSVTSPADDAILNPK
jgi:dipeptidyl aminopeptidase/acylaminoacyl peptidase